MITTQRFLCQNYDDYLTYMSCYIIPPSFTLVEDKTKHIINKTNACKGHSIVGGCATTGAGAPMCGFNRSTEIHVRVALSPAAASSSPAPAQGMGRGM